MGIGMVIAVLGVGSTLASTITINGGPNTEFGQGVQRTVFCGGEQSIAVKPISSYLNTVETSTPISDGESEHEDSVSTTPPGSFYLSGIQVSKIPAECSGVNFVLTVYAADGSAPETITAQDGSALIYPTVLWKRYTNSEDKAALSRSKSGWVPPGVLASLKVGSKTVDGQKGSFTITFDPLDFNIDINSVGRILIETQDDVFDGYGDGSLLTGSRVNS
jgi:hypothetical protein